MTERTFTKAYLPLRNVEVKPTSASVHSQLKYPNMENVTSSNVRTMVAAASVSVGPKTKILNRAPSPEPKRQQITQGEFGGEGVPCTHTTVASWKQRRGGVRWAARREQAQMSRPVVVEKCIPMFDGWEGEQKGLLSSNLLSALMWN